LDSGFWLLGEGVAAATLPKRKSRAKDPKSDVFVEINSSSQHKGVQLNKSDHTASTNGHQQKTAQQEGRLQPRQPFA
jgi:hypothetical protein